MSFKAMGFASLQELNQYLEQNPDVIPGSMVQGFVQNSVAVLLEGDFPVVEEIGLLAQPMEATDDTIVALENAKPVDVGAMIRIDEEMMTVLDVTDPNNLSVSRGSPSGAHAVGAVVYIG